MLNKTFDRNSKIITKSAEITDDNIEQDKLVDGVPAETLAPKKAPLLPMSPLAASATVINLILATGPFR